MRSGPLIADYLWLFALAVIWGGSFTFIKIGVETVPAATTTFLRLVVASAVMVAIALWRGERLEAGYRLWVLIFFASLTGNAIPFTLISWGEERVDSGLAAILMGVMPLTTMVIAHMLTADDRLTAGKLAGVALGFVGLVILIGPARLTSLGGDVIRELAIAAAAVSYGINANATRALTGSPPHATIAAVMVISAAIMAPVALVADQPWTLAPSTASIAAIVTLGIFQTALGTVILFLLVRRQGASFFSQINFLVPISGVIWGAVVLSERPPLSALVALGAILAGVAVARMSRKNGH
jgi:drug/metabolite transporter (DMT)-like permease